MDGYPNAHLLVDAAWLAARLDDPSVVVLSVGISGRDGRLPPEIIPGARPLWFGYAQGAVNDIPGCLIGVALAHQLGSLGIAPEQTLVLYEDGFGTAVSQAFWALERLGHADVRVMRDGLAGWKAAGQPLSRGNTPPPRLGQTPYPVRLNEACFADASWVQSHAEAAILLDARTPQEFCAGHIPGARLWSWDSHLRPGTPPRLAPAGEVQAAAAARGVQPDTEVVTYCRSGTRASFLYLMLRLLGQRHVRQFDGSLVEWTLRALPFEAAGDRVKTPFVS